MRVSYELAKSSESSEKWKQLGELAMGRCQFGLALECFHHAKDYSGLLLLATSAGDAGTLERLAETTSSAGKNNVTFISNFLLGRLEECLELLISTGRFAEAAFFCRTYLPSHISKVVGLWRDELAKKNPKAAQSLADPTDYENLFPERLSALKAEKYLKKERTTLRPAGDYPVVVSTERNIIDEMEEAEKKGIIEDDDELSIDLEDEDIDTTGVDLDVDEEDLLAD